MNTENKNIDIRVDQPNKAADAVEQPEREKRGLTTQIFIAMIFGVVVGSFIKFLGSPILESFISNTLGLPVSVHQHITHFLHVYVTHGALQFGATIFLNVLQMLVVPIVFISLVCGTCSLDSSRRFGLLAGKTLVFYTVTTAIAIVIAISLANLFNVGITNLDMTAMDSTSLEHGQLPSLRETFLNMFPTNPIAALASGNMMQIIVFAILLGIAITWAKERGQRIRNFFQDFDDVIIHLMHIVLKLAPFGVFCLIAKLIPDLGYDIFSQLAHYFLILTFILAIQLFVVYSSILYFMGGLSPIPFFQKMAPALLFAFSTSSSSASIPVVLDVVENKLGVKESIAAFVVPLGATINMAGTAMMQGVATVFIANSYGIDIGLAGYAQVVIIATVASIGTAGVPSVGTITLAVVLKQVGLPVEGIMLILSVDRLLDMTRTAVNVSGDAIIACVIAKSEHAIDLDRYNDMSTIDGADENLDNYQR